jgi:hypothetical protein
MGMEEGGLIGKSGFILDNIDRDAYLRERRWIR